MGTRRFEREALPANCVLMINGRERVGLGHPHDVSRLDLVDSETLFRYHAGLEVDVDVSEICNMLGGHPMALEIAGKIAFIYGLSAKELLERLLDAGEYVPKLALSKEAYENLWVTLYTSYEALTEDERLLFRMFGSLWATTATAELLSFVINFNIHKTQNILDNLVSHSLVTPENTPEGLRRYRIHELCQDFARAILRENSQQDLSHLQALEACITYAKRYARKDRSAHDNLDAELLNLILAAQWGSEMERWEAVNQLALDLWENSNFLDWRGYANESKNLLIRGLVAANSLNNKENIETHLRNLGNVYLELGLADKAIEHLNQALDITREINNRQDENKILGQIGLSYRRKGEMGLAIKHTQEALDISREIGDRYLESVHLGNLGQYHRQLGQTLEAINYYLEALKAAEEVQDKHNKHLLLGYLGVSYSILGRVDEAISYHKEALNVAREINDRRGEGYHLGDLGVTYMRIGQIEDAIRFYQQALLVHREISDQRMEGIHLGNLGLAYIDLEQADTALQNFQQALEIAQQLDDRRRVCLQLSNLGLAYICLNQIDEAISSLNKSLEIARQLGDKRHEGVDLGLLGEAYMKQGKLDLAETLSHQAIALHRGIDYTRGIGNWMHNLGNITILKAEETSRDDAQALVQKAIEYYEEALAIRRKIKDPHVRDSETAIQRARDHPALTS